MAGSNITAAIDRGVRRLEASIAGEHWTGFPTLAGRSDVWVTAFVVAHLDSIAPRRPILARARRYLIRQQQASGGFGYGGRGVPADADSTAWCLTAFGASRTLSADAGVRARKFLAAHRTDRGFVTYLPESGIREFIKATGDASIEGWTSVHPDVTASALMAGCPARGTGVARSLLGRLMASQTAAGLIPAYWWRSPFYTLAMALRACMVHRLTPSRDFVEGALEALDMKRLPNGGYGLGASDETDGFTTALALEIYSRLLGKKSSAAVASATEALLSAQQPDGGWRGAPVLRIPAPSVTNPMMVHGWKMDTGGGNAFVRDEGGIFATALACHALALRVALKDGRPVAVNRTWPEPELPDDVLDTEISVVAVTNPPALERCTI